MWPPACGDIIHFDSESRLNVAPLVENPASLSTNAAMPTDIRAIAAEEVDEFERCLGVGFGEIAPPEHISTWGPLLDPQRCLAAFDGDDMVGGAAAITLGITVPGTIVPTGAVLGAAILPTHRRQGLLRTRVQRHLPAMHDR